METYTVKPGDTLSEIALTARNYGNTVTWEEIATANGIIYPFIIQPGQMLQIPGVRRLTTMPVPRPENNVYDYTFEPIKTPINKNILYLVGGALLLFALMRG